MKDKMMLYGVTLARRFNNKQKEIFLNEVITNCNKLNKKTSFMTMHNKVNHVCNLVKSDYLFSISKWFLNNLVGLQSRSDNLFRCYMQGSLFC